MRGKIQDHGFQLKNGQLIKAMLADETYKYLGVKQARCVDHATVKNELSTEFAGRIRQVLKTSLNSRNIIKAINTYAVPVLGYSFGVIKWSTTEIEGLERKLRTLMTKERKHHPKSAVERITLPRHLGGRGVVDIGNQQSQHIKSLREFFHKEAETSTLHRAVCLADGCTPLKLSRLDYNGNIYTEQQKLETWMGKPLHGKHLYAISQDHVDMKASNYWLIAGQMFPETEGTMLAIQDQVIPTRSYLKAIVRDPGVQDDRCRYGCQAQENIHHITSGCTHFSGTDYKQRHDVVGKILHQELAYQHQLIECKVPYYKYVPNNVLENDECRLYWDRTILTDQTATHNRPDLVLVDKTKRQVYLIDIAIPNTKNLQEKYVEKISKYAPLVESIKKQWHMDLVRIIPIVISSTAVIPKTLFQSLKDLNINVNIYKTMQKAVVISTTGITRKFMGVG